MGRYLLKPISLHTHTSVLTLLVNNRTCHIESSWLYMTRSSHQSPHPTPTPHLQKWYRIGGVALLALLVGWVASQPTEFSSFVHAQKKIVDDLYAGTLLADSSGGPGAVSAGGGGFGGWRAQYGAGAYGGRRANVPDLEQLKKQLEEATEEEAGAGKGSEGEAASGTSAAGEGEGGSGGDSDDIRAPGDDAPPRAHAAPDLDAMLASDDAAEEVERETGAGAPEEVSVGASGETVPVNA